MSHAKYASGVCKLEWIGDRYAYQNVRGGIVYIYKTQGGWVSEWINPPTSNTKPTLLPSVGVYKTLFSAFHSSLSLM